MCWLTRGRKPKPRKVMRAPITVFKVIYGRADGIRSPFRDFKYNVPKTYDLGKEMMPEKMKVSDGWGWEINEGYHSYSLECHYTGGRVFHLESLLMDYSMFGMTCGMPMILECRLPKLSKYYKNSDGVIVSDALETVALHTEAQWNKRLEEIKKERHL